MLLNPHAFVLAVPQVNICKMEIKMLLYPMEMLWG